MPIPNDLSQFRYGGANYPLDTSTGNSLLQDADPSLFYALEYFQSVLNTHLGSRLTAEALKVPQIKGITQAVAQVTPIDPTPYLQEQQFQFPLLAVYRKKEKNIWKTIAVWDDEGEWGLDYILPPLTGAQMERMAPILRSAGRILLNRIENKMDPGYRNGTDVWALANLEEIRIEEAMYGGFASTGNLYFPAYRAKLHVKECDILDSNAPSNAGTAFSGLQDLTGIDEQTDLVDPAGIDPTLTHVVDVQKTFP